MDKKSLTEIQLAELDNLKYKCIFILTFIGERHGDTQLLRDFTTIVESEYGKHNLKGLTMVYDDLCDWSKHFEPSDRAELYNRMKSELKIDITKDNERVLKKIKRIINRGMILNDNEYRLLSDRVEEIYSNETRADEAGVLKELLAKYHIERSRKKSKP